MPIIQEPIGYGHIVWLGVNTKRGTFSSPRSDVDIVEDGIYIDIYRGTWRSMSGHDVDYVATDGVKRGDSVLNLRQITIVDSLEVCAAGTELGIIIEPGMLRENLMVEYHSLDGTSFSKLSPLSRMVIGDQSPKVLLLTEENGPCKTITGMIGLHLKQPHIINPLREALRGRRGQMAMVRSWKDKRVEIGDNFKIFPPMT